MFNRIYRNGQFKCFLAKDLDEAYKLKFFSGSITLYELMDRVVKHNKHLRWFANKTHKALWDTSKGERGFICGITNTSIIPRYSIMQYDFSKDKKVEWCNMYGEITGNETVNPDESEYQVLARGWEAIFNILEKKGYEIDKKGL